VSEQPDRVADEEVLYRRVLVGQNHYKLVDGSLRVSAQAFSDRKGAPSVDRAVLLGHDPRRARRSETDGVVGVVARDVRGLDVSKQGNPVIRYRIDVHPDPIPESADQPANPAHAEIRPAPPIESDNVFRRLRQALAELASRRWEIRPADFAADR
jgi:hypothetical protein